MSNSLEIGCHVVYRRFSSSDFVKNVVLRLQLGSAILAKTHFESVNKSSGRE